MRKGRRVEQRGLDHALGAGRPAGDDRPIGLAGEPGGEQALRLDQGGAPEGDDEAARGVGVEAMDQRCDCQIT